MTKSKDININDCILDVVHQKAYGRSYMWSYYVRCGDECILSGGVYASSYPTRLAAMIQIKKELKSRMCLDDAQLSILINN